MKFEMPEDFRKKMEEVFGPFYILERTKIKSVSFMEWSAWMKDFEKRRIDKTAINDDVSISTVFLPLDHNLDC